MSDTKTPNKRYRTFVLLLLTLVYAFNFVDRQIIGILSPEIQKDLGLSYSQLGYLKGIVFALFYTIIGLPIAWLADRYNRVTIVSVALAVWSGFTALTGFANNFVQIGLARMGVGIGEAGGSPPSHSIISDLYPKEQRATALAVYSLGIPFGIMFAYFAAGLIVESFGWRMTFIILGIPGIVLALIVRLVIREPVRGAMEGPKDKLPDQAPFKEALKTLLTIPSWWAMCMGIALASFLSYAISAWQMDYLKPFNLGFENPMEYKTLMNYLGVMNGIFYAGGTFLGGYLASKLAKKNVNAYGLVPAAALLVALPAILASFWVQSVELHLIYATIFLFCIGMYLGPSFAVAQTLAPINMRAMSTAIFFLILNLIALGGGPTFVGLLADMFLEQHGDIHAIRLALSITSLVLVLAIISFLIAARNLPKDWALAKERNEGLAKTDA